ncbi:MAG TPA: sulfur reduction protein DsrE [Aquifex aeolicus]|nr:sulfur reduction protein DsrE [Aquifex aeolicus]
MKKVVHILKGDPFSWKSHEALRVATATAINNETYFICIRDGVYFLTKWESEKLGIESLEKFKDTLEFINLTLIAEEESLHDRGILKTELAFNNVRIMNSEDIKNLIHEADFLFVW